MNQNIEKDVKNRTQIPGGNCNICKGYLGLSLMFEDINLQQK